MTYQPEQDRQQREPSTVLVPFVGCSHVVGDPTLIDEAVMLKQSAQLNQVRDTLRLPFPEYLKGG